MPRYLLHHRHQPHECGVAFASFRGDDSPVRRSTAVASCRTGGHEIWWLVDAASAPDALAQLPWYIATRASATPITEVQIP